MGHLAVGARVIMRIGLCRLGMDMEGEAVAGATGRLLLLLLLGRRTSLNSVVQDMVVEEDVPDQPVYLVALLRGRGDEIRLSETSFVLNSYCCG
jgi:hypothetical protein